MKTGRLPFEAEWQPSSMHDKDGGDDDDANAHVNLDSFVPVVRVSCLRIGFFGAIWGR
jgi:hypothetical protein